MKFIRITVALNLGRFLWVQLDPQTVFYLAEGSVRAPPKKFFAVVEAKTWIKYCP
jgi:hypothetical protein